MPLERRVILTGGRNNLIDGWRGLSVLLVIAGHLVSFRFSDGVQPTPVHELVQSEAWLDLIRNIALRVCAPLGEIGVNFFFVISGYLITSLGKIRIAGFYIRRTFRIFPAIICIFYDHAAPLFRIISSRQRGLHPKRGLRL